MKWGEIVRKYKREWVLLEDVRVDKNFRIKEGKVLLHSTDKHEIYNRLLELRLKDLQLNSQVKYPII